MTDEEIKRINVLYHKSKAEGLSPAEAEEQKRLRRKYIDEVKGSVVSNLKNVSILEPDGRITHMSSVIKNTVKQGKP